ncbi:MAG: hypothetical protein ACK4P1_08975, partial [Aggregatilineales bacterium]
MIQLRTLARLWLVALLSLLSAACATDGAVRLPTEAPHYQKTATFAAPIHTPVIGQFGAVSDPSATPILAAQLSPSPVTQLAALGTPAFTATFGAVVDSSPAPTVASPSPSPMPALGTPKPTSLFGAVVDP